MYQAGNKNQRSSNRANPVKEKDIDGIVRYLTMTFNRVIAPLGKPNRDKHDGPNLAYSMQTEFAYRLNEVMQGPRGVLQDNIVKCNEYIDEAMSIVASQGTTRKW